MSHDQRMSELSLKRSLLKSEGRFREAIPYQLEIIELMMEQNPAIEQLANAHNMASVLYLGAKLYASAEWHGRKALALRTDDSAKAHEARGAYNLVMARILASRFEFEEAAVFGQKAIEEYSHWHNPPDEFLRTISAEMDAIKNRTWTPPE